MNKNNTPLQLDLIGYSGLKTTKRARTWFAQVDRLARFHDSQNRRDATISITPKQAEELAKTLKIAGRALTWRGHPLVVVEEQ